MEEKEREKKTAAAGTTRTRCSTRKRKSLYMANFFSWAAFRCNVCSRTEVLSCIISD